MKLPARLMLSLSVTGLICLPVLFAVATNDRTIDKDKQAEASRQKSAPGGPFGIEKRVPWTTSRITGSLETPPPYKVERVFGKLQFDKLVALTTSPGSERMFAVEVDGRVFSFRDDAADPSPDLFVDLKKEIDGVSRIYGIAFHPDFDRNRYVYLCYVLKEGDPKGTRVSRFTVSDADPPVVDIQTETPVIAWQSGGHNGGCLKFGPRDGCLYISTGDASSPSPPDSRSTGQDNGDLLSCILRIDVDHPAAGKGYSVPVDNPFVGIEGTRPEIWAYGFRNPWRMNFDAETGWLWAGDVGWEMWEMVYRVERGGNYGWSIVEGPQPVRGELSEGSTPILPPVASHSHIESRSLTGGAVYRGKRLKELRGVYIYGDYVTGKIWGLRYDGKQVTWQQELSDTSLAVIAFAENREGELYVLDYAGGIYRLTSSESGGANQDFPRKLSQTGLFASVKNHTLAAGVIPYSINAEPWADNAVAERFIAVPGAPKLEVWTTENAQVGNIRGNWNYPLDTVFAKTLSMEMKVGDPRSLKRLETQVLHRHGDSWNAYTYIWNDEQTDALLAPAEGLDKKLVIRDPAAPGGKRQQAWHFASRTECLVCHTSRGGSVYGFVSPQLNKEHDYGKVTADQLATLVHIGLFDDPSKTQPVNPEHRVPVMPNPNDESQKLSARARAYLHVNCAHCHRRGGGGTAKFVLQFHLDRDKLSLIGERPSQGAFNIYGAENVAAGDPYRSLLYYRLAKLGNGHMPKIGSGVIDTDGLRLIHDWIAKMEKPSEDNETGRSTANLRGEQLAALSKLRQAGDGASATIDQLLSTTSGALMVLSAVDAGRFNEPLQRQVLATATTHASPEIRELFERFVPEEKRVKRLGSVVRPDEILSLGGTAKEGQKVFFQTTGVQCKNCHQINKQGKQVGPDLSRIAKKYNRAQLLETILEPSKKIEKEYVTYFVETTAGRVHTGLLVQRSSEEIVLKDSQGKLIRIAAGDVELFAPQRKSMMPELLLKELTAQQVADLLAYLTTLK